MEEFLKLLISKRRTSQLFSNSYLDTLPEPKKLRECKNANSPEGERDGEGDDIILSALNMTEVIQKPLQEILKKLEKLDTIEGAVNNLQKSFEKLEGRIQTVEDAYATTKHDVEDLKERLNANETDKKTTAEKIQKVEDNIKSSLADLQKTNDELRAKVKLIEDKKTYIWKHTRGAKILSLRTFQKKERTKRTRTWCCAPSWKWNWVSATLLTLKYSVSIDLEKGKAKVLDQFLLDFYDTRTAKAFFHWGTVYGELTTKCIKIFRLRLWNVGERRWKPLKKQDTKTFPQPSAKLSLTNCT